MSQITDGVSAASLPSLETDPLSIHLDGTSTTTAAIPFAVGAVIKDNQFVYFGDETSGSGLVGKGFIQLYDDFIERQFLLGGSNVLSGPGLSFFIQGGASGTAGLAGGSITLSAGISGSGGTSGNLNLMGGNRNSGNAGYVRVGNTGTPGHFTLTSNDTAKSLYINKNLEVDGTTWLDGALNVTGTTTLSTSLTGLLEATAGVVGTATAGTDYVQTVSVASPILNTGTAANPTIDFDETANFTWSGTHLFNNNLTIADSSTGSGPYLNIGDNSMASGYVSIQNDQALTGNIYIEPQGGFAGEIYFKELGATIEGSVNLGNLNHSTLAQVGASLSSPIVTATGTSDAFSVRKQSTSAAIRANLVQAEWAGTSTASVAIQGQNIFVSTSTGATGSLTGSNALRANRAVVRHRATNVGATVANAMAMSTQIILDTSAAAMTNASSYVVESPSIGLGSTLTNYYGIKYDTVSVLGGLTNYYGLFIPSVTAAGSNFEIWLDTDAGIFFRQSGNQISSPSSGVIQYDAATRHDFTQNIQITKATPSLTFTDSGGDDYIIDVGSSAGLLRIRNTTDSSNGLQIDGSGNVAVSTSYPPQSSSKFYAQDRITDPTSGAKAAFGATMEVIVTSANWSGGNMRGFLGGVYWDGSTRDFNNGAVLVGLEGGTTIANMAATRIVQSAIGLFGSNQISGTGGTITTASGITHFASVSGGVVVTTYNIFNPSTLTPSGGSTITTLCGYRVPVQTGGTTNYDMLFDTTAKANFRDGNQYIQSSAASTLDLSANTTMNFRAAGAIEMTMAANSLTFNNGATDCFIDWTTTGILKFYSGATNFYEYGSENVFNQNGGKIVFRVEGDTDQNLIYTDPANDRVGIGTSTPTYKFEVSGKMYTTSEIEIDGALNHDGTTVGFYAATPVTQGASTGETVGFTAGAGTNVTDASTFTGNVGATAYRISDIVKHLKNLGLIAS